MVYDGSFRIINLESFSSIEAASEMNARMNGPFASNATTPITVDPRRIVMFENDRLDCIIFNETSHMNLLPSLTDAVSPADNNNRTKSAFQFSLIQRNYKK